MHKRIAVLALCGLACLLPASPSHATVITFEVENIADDTWQYTYTVGNDTLATDIAWFSVYFPVGLFANLVAGAAPPGWDPLVLQPDAALPADGLYDVLALVLGIAPGETLGGFSVQFDFLGSGTPGSQFFEVYDPETVAVIDSGFTSPAVSVPEPPTIGLLGAALVVLAGLRARRRAR